MEDLDIINLWKTQDAKIEQSLAINKKLLSEVLNQKAQSALTSLRKGKVFGVIVAVIYLSILGIILLYATTNYSSNSNYFIVSLGVIFLINIKALYDYIKQLIWINSINYDGNVTEIQQQLTKLQLSIIKHVRIMFLQFPFWTTIYLSSAWFPGQVNWLYIIFQIVLTGSFAFISYWAFKNLTLENTENKLVNSILSGSGGKQTIKALAFYKEIEQFKTEN